MMAGAGLVAMASGCADAVGRHTEGDGGDATPDRASDAALAGGDARDALDAPNAVDVPEVPDVPDALDGVDGARDAATTPVLRPIAPLSTATVTSHRPTLRWSLPPGADGAHVEICRDRACTMVLSSFDAVGTSAAPAEELPAGVAFWRLRARAGGVTSGSMSAVWQFTVGARSAPVDTSWGTTLDVNGDGYADVAVGDSPVGFEPAHVYLYLGGPTGVATEAAVTLSPPGGGGIYFGDSIESAGDVNGDGFGDLVVGAGDLMASAVRVYVYFGGPGGLTPTPSAVLLPSGGLPDTRAAIAASGGDLNGDGYADLLVGLPAANAFAGAAFVFLGGPTGPALAPAALLAGTAGGIQQFGASLASAGDVDGDGYGDVIVGAWGTNTASGRAYLFLGSSRGIATTPRATFTGRDELQDEFGETVRCAGDVNGDGYADVVIGAYGANAAYVYTGAATGLAATPFATLVDPVGGHDFFADSVAGDGDFDGDGYADVLVSASGQAGDAGYVYVYRGGPAGIGPAPAARLDAPDGAGSDFGNGLATAGDVNGDGRGDALIGAQVANGSAGRAYVYLGGAAGLGDAPGITLLGANAGGSFFGGVLARAETGPRGGAPLAPPPLHCAARRTRAPRADKRPPCPAAALRVRSACRAEYRATS